MEKALIVAVADNLAIGKGNDMPWHISEDLKYFKRTTIGCPVIMGSLTFKSLGSRPLPKRKNIVISRSANLDLPEGVAKASSLEEAYTIAEQACNEAENNPGKCFVMGGGYTYRQAIEDVDVMYVTHVHTIIEDADVYFPNIDMNIWEKTKKSETFVDPETGFSYESVEYRRK